MLRTTLTCNLSPISHAKPKSCPFNMLTSYVPRFFKIRNPLLGLLDPSLHTAEYVYSASFTLFSTVCGLGCALSTRPRDRAMYAVLMGLATANIQWSIAASIRSLETIQAIVLMQYWAPICESQTEDPYWLYLSHVSHSYCTLQRTQMSFGGLILTGCTIGAGNRHR